MQEGIPARTANTPAHTHSKDHTVLCALGPGVACSEKSSKFSDLPLTVPSSPPLPQNATEQHTLSCPSFTSAEDPADATTDRQNLANLLRKWVVSYNSTNVTLLGPPDSGKSFFVNALLESEHSNVQEHPLHLTQPFPNAVPPSDSDDVLPYWDGSERVIYEEVIPDGFAAESTGRGHDPAEPCTPSARTPPSEFLLPKHTDKQHVTCLKYRDVAELTAHFMPESKLREEYQALLEHPPPLPREKLHLLRTTVHWCTDELADAAVERAFRTYRDGTEVPIKKEVAALLGNCVKYHGSGRDASADREYLRARLFSVVDAYSLLLDSVLVGFPAKFLRGLQLLTLCAPFQPLCDEVVRTTTLLLLSSTSDDIDAGVRAVLSRSPFLPDLVGCSEMRGLAVVDMREDIARLAAAAPHGADAADALERYVNTSAVVDARRARVQKTKAQLLDLLRSAPVLSTVPSRTLEATVSRTDVHFIDACGYITSFRRHQRAPWSGVEGLRCMIENFVVAQCSAKLGDFSKSWVARRHPRNGRKLVVLSKLRTSRGSRTLQEASTAEGLPKDRAHATAATAAMELEPRQGSTETGATSGVPSDGHDARSSSSSSFTLSGVLAGRDAYGDAGSSVASESSEQRQSDEGLDDIDALADRMDAELFVGAERDTAHSVTSTGAVFTALTSDLSTWRQFFEAATVRRSANVQERLGAVLRNALEMLSEKAPAAPVVRSCGTSLPGSLCVPPHVLASSSVLGTCGVLWDVLCRRVVACWKTLWSEELVDALTQKESELHAITQRAFTSAAALVGPEGQLDDAGQQRLQALRILQNRVARLIVDAVADVKAALEGADVEGTVKATLAPFEALAPPVTQPVGDFLAPLFCDAVNATVASCCALFTGAAARRATGLLREVVNDMTLALSPARGALRVLDGVRAGTSKAYSPSAATLARISPRWLVCEQGQPRERSSGTTAPDFSSLSPALRTYCELVAASLCGCPVHEEDAETRTAAAAAAAAVAAAVAGFNERLKAAALSVSDVAADSNALFRSLAHLLGLEEEGYPVVKLLVMNELVAGAGRYERFFASSERFQCYVNGLLEDTFRGDFLTLTAFVGATKSALVLLAPQQDVPLLIAPTAGRFAAASRTDTPFSHDAPSLGAEHTEYSFARLMPLPASMDVEEHRTATPGKERNDGVQTTTPCLGEIAPTATPAPAPTSTTTLAVAKRSEEDAYYSSKEVAAAMHVPFFALAVFHDRIAPLTQSPVSAGAKRQPTDSTDQLVHKRRNSANQQYDVELSPVDGEGTLQRSSSLNGLSDVDAAAAAAAATERGSWHGGRVLSLEQTRPAAAIAALVADESVRLASVDAEQLAALVQALDAFQPIDGIDFDRVLSVVLAGALGVSAPPPPPPPVALCLPRSSALTNFTCRAITETVARFGKRQGVEGEAFRCIGSIDLTASPHLSDEGVLVLLRGLPRLERLVLDGCALVTDQAFVALTASDKRDLSLRTLSVSRCTRLTNAGVLALSDVATLRELSVAHCKKVSSAGLLRLSCLEALDVSHCTGVDNAFFAALPARHPHLRELKAAGASAGDSVIGGVLPRLCELATLEIGGTKCGLQTLSAALGHTHLTRLSLADCKGVDSTTWTLAASRVRSTGAPLLGAVQALDLSGCVALDFAVVAASLQGAGGLRLTSLKLARTRVADRALDSVLRQTSGVSVLDASGCGTLLTDVGVAALVGHTGACLRKASFAHTGITDAGAIIVAAHCPGITFFACSSTEVTDKGVARLAQNCHALTTLVLDNLDLTDFSVRRIVEGCRGLQHLSVARNKRLTDAAVVALVGEDAQTQAEPHVPLPLRSLDVSYTKVGAVGFAACVARLPTLEELTANGLTLSTETGLADTPLYSLRSLSLAWNATLTDTFVIGLAPLLPSLRVLVLTHCPLVTDAALRHVGARCSLAQLHIRGCERVTEDGVRAAVAGRSVVVVR